MDGLTGTKGGSGVWQRIISEIPPHDVFIEAFYGRGVISQKKRPAAITIGLDLDPVAISHGRARGRLMFLACALQWLADYFAAGDAETSGGRSRSRAAQSGVPDLAATFGGAAWSRHFVYIDPPYLGCEGYYKHELSREQHVDLCRLFLSLPCPAALSGYMTDVHAAELSGCRSISYWTVKRSGEKVREHLWMNFAPPSVLHDARFVGNGRRQRERIRRRVTNWSAGLKRMKPAERQAVFEALAAEYGDVAGHASQ